jgi:hypothetical protein
MDINRRLRKLKARVVGGPFMRVLCAWVGLHDVHLPHSPATHVMLPASMAGTFNLTSVHVFPCPNCKETINTSMQQCQFCGTPIDAISAQKSADATSRISASVSDASYLKVMAWSLLTFFLLIFIPVLGLIGIVGLVFVTYALPVMCIRWWIKYGSIKTDDADFPRARLAAIVVTVIASLNLLRDTGTRIAHHI